MDGASGYVYQELREDEKKDYNYQESPLTQVERFLLSNEKTIWEIPKKEFPNDMVGCSSNWFLENHQKSSFDGGFSRFLQRKGETSLAMKKNNNSCSNIEASMVIKGQWTLEEDKLFELLVQLVEQYGERKWSQIAQMFPGRIGKQCRERWHNHLRPDIKKDSWSVEEERMLVEAHAKIGNKWAEIAKRIPGRTENSIKNHWNATRRKQNSKRKIGKSTNQGATPSSSILMDYLKNLKENSMTKIPHYPIPQKTQEFPILDSISIADDHKGSSLFYKEDIPFPPALSLDDQELYTGQIQYQNFEYDLDELKEPEDCSLLFSSTVENNFGNICEEENSHLYSDFNLSSLFEETTPVSANEEEGENLQHHLDQASSLSFKEGKQDMDLIELVSASFLSQRSSS